MIRNFKKLNLDIFLKKNELNSFYLSAIFIPSALPIGILLLIISIFSFIFEDNKNFKKDQINYLFLLVIVFMIISCIISYINFDIGMVESYWNKKVIQNTQKINIFIDLCNWLPFFLLYFVSQKYLQNVDGRIKFARNLLIGTLPVILSFILQYWFRLYGPFKFLFGTIVWFQKPLEDGIGVSGLFSNQNYAAAWLTTILPFSIFYIYKNKSQFLKRIFSSILLLIISYFIILTNSRNALFGLILSFVIFFGLRGPLNLFFISFLGGLSILGFYLLIPKFFDQFIYALLSNPLINKLINFEITNYIRYPRLEILNITFNLIPQRPIWGFGSGTFPSMYGASGGLYDAQHTHSLPIQIAYDYGIPVAFLICLIVTYLFLRSFRLIFFNANNSDLIDKSWLVACLITILCNLSDITYFDGKISILFWILLGGINCIFHERKLARDQSK